jgi:DNA N-6-adenine-methyltransferase (Dam)
MAARTPQKPRRTDPKPNPGFAYEQPGGGRTDEWYTPPEVFEALGLDFDLDPAAPPGGVPWVPARRSYCLADDGLTQSWRGRCWLNPPYGRQTDSWISRLAEHGDGLALVYARTDTRWFHAALSRATAICFIAGRLHFIADDHRRRSNATAPSVLIAYGLPCALALAESELGQTLVVPRPGLSQ